MVNDGCARTGRPEGPKSDVGGGRHSEGESVFLINHPLRLLASTLRVGSPELLRELLRRSDLCHARNATPSASDVLAGLRVALGGGRRC